MNPEICKNCKKRPDFYRVDGFIANFYGVDGFIENRIMKLEGIKINNNNYVTSTKCHLYITDEEHIDKIEEALFNKTNDVRYKCYIGLLKPEKINNKINEIDETCPYYLEHQISDWNNQK